MSLDPAWIALISTVAGGVSLKVIEHWLSRGKVKIDEAHRLREELRLEITSLRADIKEQESEVDRWRAEYYNLRDEYMEVKAELNAALLRIKSEAMRAEETIQTAIDPQDR